MRTNETFRSKDLERIVECARPAVFSYLKAKGVKLSSCDVEEILSETTLRVYMNWDNYDESQAKFSTWVSTIARNCACDLMSKEIRRRNTFSPMSMQKRDGELYEMDYSDREASQNSRADYAIISRENLRMIDKASRGLGETNYFILTRRVNGFNNQEIADEMGCSEGAVRTRYCRALGQLRKNEEVNALRSWYLSQPKVA